MSNDPALKPKDKEAHKFIKKRSKIVDECIPQITKKLRELFGLIDLIHIQIPQFEDDPNIFNNATKEFDDHMDNYVKNTKTYRTNPKTAKRIVNAGHQSTKEEANFFAAYFDLIHDWIQSICSINEIKDYRKDVVCIFSIKTILNCSYFQTNHGTEAILRSTTLRDRKCIHQSLNKLYSKLSISLLKKNRQKWLCKHQIVSNKSNKRKTASQMTINAKEFRLYILKLVEYYYNNEVNKLLNKKELQINIDIVEYFQLQNNYASSSALQPTIQHTYYNTSSFNNYNTYYQYTPQPVYNIPQPVYISNGSQIFPPNMTDINYYNEMPTGYSPSRCSINGYCQMQRNAPYYDNMNVGNYYNSQNQSIYSRNQSMYYDNRNFGNYYNSQNVSNQPYLGNNDQNNIDYNK